jgi:hypothetical protein
MAVYFKSGKYTGTGSAQSITGFTFKPKFLLIKGAGTTYGYYKTLNELTNRFWKLSGGDVKNDANGITTLNDNGFSLGGNYTDLNANGTVYYYFAFGGDEITTGTYTGDGNDNRDIAASTFTPMLVLVRGNNGAQNLIFKINDAVDSAFNYRSAIANRIQAMNANGFQVGTDATTNSSGATYTYICIGVTASQKVIKYTGNSTDNRNVTGAGFNPDFVMINRNDGAVNPVFRPSNVTGDSSCFYEDIANEANLVQSFITDGFQLGSNGRINNNATGYSSLCLIDTPKVETTTTTNTQSRGSKSNSPLDGAQANPYRGSDKSNIKFH